MSLNIEHAIEMFAHIELGELDPVGTGHGTWNQGTWGSLFVPPEALGNRTWAEMREVLNDTEGNRLGHASCGRAFCAAGWATQLSGAQIEWVDDGEVDERGWRTFTGDATTDGESVSKVACRYLGITDQTRYSGHEPNMFNGDNVLEEVYSLCHEFITDEADLERFPDWQSLKAAALLRLGELTRKVVPTPTH